MLDMEKSGYFTDVIHNSIPYSGIEYAIISTPIYNRLHRILQNSLVYLTYPSNKVKRFEHSIGTMHLAGEMFFNSICNSSKNDFISFMNAIADELVNWRNTIDFNKYSFAASELRTLHSGQDILLAPVPNNSLYNKFCPKFLSKENVFPFYVVFQAVRIAGLLHDVGHLPYSHILEHALQKMYKIISTQPEQTDIEKEFLKIMKRFAEGENEIHEEIGNLLISNIRNTIVQDIVDKTNPNIYFFLATLDFAQNILSSKTTDNDIFSNLHFIIASVLDADRLDYCTRDSFCAGTNKAIYPYSALLLNYKMIKIEEDKTCNFYFCPSTKSLFTIEELLRRRYQIFLEINYHHRVHKHEILLEEVIVNLGVDELHNMRTISDLPYTLPLYISSIWKLISKLDSSNNWPEYQIIQLDDSWLDTLLKINFFEKYKEKYLSLRTYGNDILWNKFDELISANKRYHSFFKRAIIFRKFDKLFFSELINRKDTLSNDLLKAMFKEDITYNKFFEKHRSFLFNYCVDVLYKTNSKKKLFFEQFELELNNAIKTKDLKIINCLLRSCMFSFGYQTAKTPLFLYDVNEKPIRIEKISSQLETFQRERAISPIFHLYYLPKYNQKYNVYEDIDPDEVLKILTEVAIKIIDTPN